MKYSNPYPHYVDCDDAFQDLIHVVTPDLEIQRAYQLENLKDFKSEVSHPLSDYSEFYEDEDIDELIKQVSEARSLDEIRCIDNIPETFRPLYFLAEDVKVLDSVEFAHTMPSDRAESIRKFTLYGRATPHKMTLTRNVEDFYIGDNGFIFAYELDSFINESVVVRFSAYLEGVAEKALSFYFIPDEEYQLIVPVKCIESYTIENWTTDPATREDLDNWSVCMRGLPDPMESRN
jgi:hypothetical protein